MWHISRLFSSPVVVLIRVPQCIPLRDRARGHMRHEEASWKESVSLDIGRCGPVSVVYENRMYLFGGKNGRVKIEYIPLHVLHRPPPQAPAPPVIRHDYCNDLLVLDVQKLQWDTVRR